MIQTMREIAAQAAAHRESPARGLIERALSEVIDGEDAIPTLSRAIAALRVEYGELDPDELDEGAGPVCTCPAELLTRGGFRGSCPVHGAPLGERFEEIPING